jgi:hypothetical protein
MGDSPTLDDVIDAFIGGRTDFLGFCRDVDALLADHPEHAQPALKRLQAMKRDGKVSPAYFALISKAVRRGSRTEDTAPRRRARQPDAAPPDAAPPDPAPPDAAAADPDPPASRWEQRHREAKTRAVSTRAGTLLLGRYRLLSLLSQGGMSMVFRGEDVSRPGWDGRPAKVAIKVANPEAGVPEASRALESEAALLSGLNHPGIVRLFSYEREGTEALLVMELLQGEGLRSRLDRSGSAPLPGEEALRITRELAEALAYLHKRKLVHRDVKPSNVIITTEGELRLVDFGLAAESGRGDKAGSPPVAWSPGYASREMLADAPPDPRDDVYSLACVVYELLAGAHPWGKLPADKAAQRGLKAKRPRGLTPARWKVLRNALAFDAARRPADATAFLEAFFPAPRRRSVLPWVAVALAGGIAAGWAMAPFLPPMPHVSEWVERMQPSPAPVLPPAPEPVVVPDPEPAVEADPVPELPAELPAEPMPEPTPEPEPGPQVEAEAPPEPLPAPSEPVPEVVPEAAPPAPQAVEPGALSLESSRYSISRRGVALRVELMRPANYAGPLRVYWRTVNGSARHDEHFIGSPEWQHAEAPATAGSIVLFVPIVDDGLPGPNLDFFIEIRQAEGGPRVAAPARAEVTLLGNR